MILLSELVRRLEEDVPAVGGIPSDEQYTRAVTEAVADFGRRAGRTKFGTLNIVSGTATYDLPADFIKIVSLPKLAVHHHHGDLSGGILNTPDGLVPLPRYGFHEETSIVNGQITFRPTPRYSLARQYSYKAGYALTDDDYDSSYADMGGDEAGIILLLAGSLAKGKQAAATGGGLSYKQGDVSVDTTGQSQNLFTSADALKVQYLAAVENYIGTIVELG